MIMFGMYFIYFQEMNFLFLCFTKKSTLLYESTTLPMRKKGEKTVAPRGPTPSFSRDVGGKSR